MLESSAMVALLLPVSLRDFITVYHILFEKANICSIFVALFFIGFSPENHLFFCKIYLKSIINYGNIVFCETTSHG